MAHTNIHWEIAYCMHNSRIEKISPLIEWVRLRHSTVRVSHNCGVKQCLHGWSFCMRIIIRNVHICECRLVHHSSPSYHFTMFKNDLVCFTRQHCMAEGARHSLREKINPLNLFLALKWPNRRYRFVFFMSVCFFFSWVIGFWARNPDG